jgi:hypothetical protein
MTNETWRPVEPYTEIYCCCESCREDDEFHPILRIEEEGDLQSEHIYFSLPPHIRLCERVEPEPISAQALAAAGWVRPIHLWINPNDDAPWDEFVAIETLDAVPGHLRVVIISDSGGEIPFRGVRTMADLADLAHLCRMLSDAPQE